MPIISVAIQKGGSGKTTTTINLGAALHNAGQKVLLIDADPQANLSQSLGLKEEPEFNLYSEIKKEITGEGSDIKKAIVEIRPGFSIVPASIELADAEMELVSAYSREQVLSWILKPVVKEYDFIFIDCPHSIGMLTVNALVACDLVLIPLQAEFLPLKGVQSFMRQFNSIKKRLKTVEQLAANRIPVNVMMAPIIPAINSHEIFALVKKVSQLGALSAAYTMIRLNGAIGEIFTDWVRKTLPERANKILSSRPTE